MSAANDLQIYERHASAWWDRSDRFFRSLHSVGNFHAGCMRSEWGEHLQGARLVDLGCGGGGVSLALAAAGAEVLGIDQSPGSVEAARQAAAERGLDAQFQTGDLRQTGLEAASADFVVMSDVLEHIEQPSEAIAEAARILRPGGELFVNTFDRSWWSRFTVVTLAEGLGLVPRGTHDGRLFVRPAELTVFGKEHGLVLRSLQRERPAIFATLRSWTIHLRRARRGPGYHAFLRRLEA